MQQFECVLCGGTNIEKRDRIYYCHTCGCRYSQEEAKKLMEKSVSKSSEESKNSHSFSAEKISNNSSTGVDNNLLYMARNAIQAENYKEAEAYCTRIVESDIKNWEAWFIKGKAAGYQSSFYNMRIKESANSFIKALAYCPKDKQLSLADDCSTEMIKMISALLQFR